MKKIIFLVVLATWAGLALAQTSLVGTGSYERYGTDLQNTVGSQVDYQPRHPFCHTSNVVSTAQDGVAGALGEVLYYYRNSVPCNGAQSLRKPIIVLDGFDPGDKRAGQELYGKQLTYINQAGQRILLGNLLRGTEPGSTDDFDVVILNFPQYLDVNGNKVDGGADDITRNAAVLVALIKQVNAQLAQAGSTEQVTIIGPSMGGLISRYALAWMEAQGQPHRCRLWVSFDSPHQGANVAMAVQQFLRFFGERGGVGSAKKNLDEKIRSKAARQMLVHHVDGSWTPDNPTAPHELRSQFVTQLANNGRPGSFGYPQDCQRVAIVNGSITGQKFSPQGCERALTMRTQVYSRSLAGSIGLLPGLVQFRPILFRQFGTPAPSIGAADLSFSGSNNQLCTTAAGYFIAPIFARLNETAASPGLSIDAAPGGSIDAFQTLKDETRGDDDKGQQMALGWYTRNHRFEVFGTNTTFGVSYPNHSFIPLKSGLAFNYQQFDDPAIDADMGNLAENLSARNLVCEGRVPFHAYYAPTENETHVALTQASVDFILPYIRGTADPVFRIRVPNSFPIQGVGSCPSTSPSGTTYNIFPGHIPADATGFQWVASPGLQIVGANNQSAVTVRRVGGASNQEWVRARIFTPCRIFEAERRLLGRGFSSSDYPITGPTSAGNNQLVYYSAPDLWGATSFQWITPGWEVVSGLNTRFLTLRTPAFGSGSGLVRVRVGNDCDAGGSPADITTLYGSGGRPGPDSGAPEPLAAPTKPLLYPNPASGMATVAVGVERGQPVQMELATASGQVVRSFGGSAFVLEPTTGQYRANIDLANLPAGIYLVRLWLADEITTLKLVVQPSGGGALSN
jgi:hypothetical protein